MAVGFVGLLAGTRYERVTTISRSVVIGFGLSQCVLVHALGALLTETPNFVDREALEEEPHVVPETPRGEGDGALQAADGRCSDAQERLLAKQLERQRRRAAAWRRT